MDTKRCTKCGETKPLTEFHFQNKAQGTRIAWCKTCKTADWLQHSPDVKWRITPRVYKGTPEWYAKQAAEQAERERKEAELAVRREANKQRKYAANRARYTPEQKRGWHQQWAQAHPDLVMANSHRRRARLRQAEGDFTVAEWEAIKARYDHRCLMCGKQEPEIKLTVDHVVPLARGGSNYASNLQPLCNRCNSKKHRKLLDLRPQSSV